MNTGNTCLEELNSISIQKDFEVARFRLIYLLNVTRDLSKKSLLNPTLDDPSMLRIIILAQVGCNDRCADALGGIDDFFDARHSQGDM